MAERPDLPDTGDGSAVLGDGAFRLVVVLALLGGLLVLIGFVRGGATPPSVATGSAAPQATSLLYAQARQAPPIELIDADARPFSLASLRGEQVLVFFGYTHCPDVCPATIGILGQVLTLVGPSTRAVFVSIDPQRDTTAWLKEFVPFLPLDFTALTGTPAQISGVAEAWGVKYARVETGSPNGYSMSHTADVYLVDTAGRLRANFPFGTDAATMIGTIRAMEASTPARGSPPTPAAMASPTSAPTSARSSTPASTSPDGGGLRPEVVSTSVWASAGNPVILALNDDSGRLNDTSIRATVQVTAGDGSTVGPAVEAVAVRPPLVERVSYVAALDFPGPGPWRLAVAASVSGRTLAGSVVVTVLDPGTTPALGAPAPDAHTPTLADVGGDARAITTDPQPDLRLSRQSTADALAAHLPFVLVIDSTRFRVTPVCGKALVMARFLVDRWPGVTFIHLEPFVYSLISETPVLAGDIADPPLSPIAAAWGIGGSPWGARSMPWVFVVDGNGRIRAKYQGLMGSDDVDVMLALIAGQR
jgi:protein SCO1/2